MLIVEGETVYDKHGSRWVVSEVSPSTVPPTVEFEGEARRGWIAKFLTHEPPIIGADGKPIEVGQTVYYDGKQYRVERIYEANDGDYGIDLEFGDLRSATNVWPGCIEHTPPDTQERIDEGKDKEFEGYWGCDGCNCEECPSLIDGEKPCGHYGIVSCDVAQGMDIARREQELRARTTGGAR